MRKLLLFGIIALGLASCGKEYTPLPVAERNPFQGSFEYTLDGIVYKTEVKEYTYHVDDNDVTSLSISAIKFSDDKEPIKNDIMVFTLPYYEGPRTYNLVGDYISAAFTKGSAVQQEPYSAEDIKIYTILKHFELEEHITIQEDGDHIKGVFEFKMLYIDPFDSNNRDTIHIQNGAFNFPK